MMISFASTVVSCKVCSSTGRESVSTRSIRMVRYTRSESLESFHILKKRGISSHKKAGVRSVISQTFFARVSREKVRQTPILRDT